MHFSGYNVPICQDGNIIAVCIRKKMSIMATMRYFMQHIPFTKTTEKWSHTRCKDFILSCWRVEYWIESKGAIMTKEYLWFIVGKGNAFVSIIRSFFGWQWSHTQGHPLHKNKINTRSNVSRCYLNVPDRGGSHCVSRKWGWLTAEEEEEGAKDKGLWKLIGYLVATNHQTHIDFLEIST